MAKRQALNPSFALIVVNYGSSPLLKRNLANIDVRGAGGLPIVVDNYTTDDERGRVEVLASKNNWEFVALDSNTGFGGGMNAGAEFALSLGAQSIIALNPDAIIEYDSLLVLSQAVHDDLNVMVAPEIRTSKGDIWFDGMWLFHHSGRVASSRRLHPPKGPVLPWITGACFAISGQMWKHLGGFDDDYFLYWEDVDLSRRVISLGGHLEINTAATAIHDEGGTQGRDENSRVKSEIYYFYNIRNRLVFAAKHLRRRALWNWILHTPLVSYEILLGGGRRQFFQSRAPWRAYFRGIGSGVSYVWKTRSR